MSEENKANDGAPIEAEETAQGVTEEASAEGTQDQPSLEAQLEASRQEAQKNYDLYLRERAEMENFRKRAQRDKADSIRFANENILREILPVADNMERALEHCDEGASELGALVEGVKMTLSQFHKVLERFEVKPVEAVGQPFDSALHEAMGQLENGEVEPNTVVQELQKGYTLSGRLLRPAMVLVSKAPAATKADEE